VCVDSVVAKSEVVSSHSVVHHARVEVAVTIEVMSLVY
jgi:hypothetical protein